MRVLGVIPARFGSTRFPGKPLKIIYGKPLLQWVIEGTRSSKYLTQVCVATDHIEIAQLAQSLGVQTVMTSSEIPTGTDRVWAAAINIQTDVVLNIQGDEPLLTGDLLDQLIKPFLQDSSIDMATLGRKMKWSDLQVNTTAKIILNQADEAIYFSRYPIPYSRQEAHPQMELNGSLKHIGLYAYRKSFLERFCSRGPCELEIYEGLEQLRALYMGAKIKVIRTDHDSWGVDTPEDIRRVEDVLKKQKHL